MRNTNSIKVAVIFFIVAEIVAVTIPVFLLSQYFNFPEILRQPAENALALFDKNQNYIVFAYYIFLVSSLLYIPLSLSLTKLFRNTVAKSALQLMTGLSIATFVFQSIGFVRWIFVVPFLSDTYLEQPNQRETIAVMYETLNRFAGMSVGEHLGFLSMGAWTMSVGFVILQSEGMKKWIGFSGIIIGILLWISMAEHFGGMNAEVFGSLNFIANTCWTFWLLTIAINIGKYRINKKTPAIAETTFELQRS